MTGRPRGEHGQATLEFAMVLPVVVLAVLLVFQVLVVADHALLVQHAAREAARAASVDPTGADARAAVARVIPGARLVVVRHGGVGANVEAHVSFIDPTSLPIVGPLVPSVSLDATTLMRIER